MPTDLDEIIEIKKVLKQHPRGLTITDLSHKIRLNRNSVAKYLEILLVSGQVEMRPYGPAKVYYLSQRVPISAMLGFYKDFVLVVDQEMRVVQVNDPFLAFSKKTRDDLIGKHVAELDLPVVGDPEVLRCIRMFDVSRDFIRSYRAETPENERFFRVRLIPTVFEGGDQGLTIITEEITAEKRYEQELAERERRFRTISELSPFPISIIDKNGLYAYANRNFTGLFGYTLEDIRRGRDWFALAFPDHAYRTKVIATWKEDLARAKVGEVRERTFRTRTKHGKDLEISYKPVTMPDGQQFVVYEDLTGRREAEKLQATMASIVESSDDAVIGMDSEGIINHWNRAAEKIFGYGPGETRGCPISVIVPSDHVGELRAVIERISHGERLRHFEMTFVRKDGAPMNVSITLSPIEDGTGTITGSSAIVRDISDRINREKEMWIRGSAIDSSLNAIGIADLGGRVTYANRAFLGMWGYSDVNEVMGMPIETFAHNHDPAKKDIETVKGKLATEGGFVEEMLAKRKDGTFFWMCLSANMVIGRDGKPLCMMASFVDVTARREAEETIRRRDRIQSFIGTVVDIVFFLDTAGVLTYVQEDVGKFGYSREEVTGKPFLDFVAQEDRERVAGILSAVTSGRPHESFEVFLMRKDGTKGRVVVNLSPVYSGERVSGIQGLARSGRDFSQISGLQG